MRSWINSVSHFRRNRTRFFLRQKNKLSIAVYEKGPKVLVQGKGVEEFVQFELEPKILGEARLGYEEVHSPEMFEPHFGVDESGKGDFFGPLVIAGVYVDRGIARKFLEAGVQDSKRISSDARIHALAESIRKIAGGLYEVVLIGPEKYNELYVKFKNLNALLGWGHARVIENLLAKKPDCPRALSDKFADARVIEKALLQHGQSIKMEQRTKAESDPAVAAASILAREGFVNWLEKRGTFAGSSAGKRRLGGSQENGGRHRGGKRRCCPAADRKSPLPHRARGGPRPFYCSATTARVAKIISLREAGKLPALICPLSWKPDCSY